MENQEFISLLQVDEHASDQLKQLLNLGARLEIDDDTQEVVVKGPHVGELIEQEYELTRQKLASLNNEASRRKTAYLLLLNAHRAYLGLALAEDITLRNP